MKRVMVMLMIAMMCNISAWCQLSIAAIGKTITQTNNFVSAKKTLVNSGFLYNESSSTESCAVYEYPGANYVDEAIIFKIYKMPKSNKVEKCVVLVGQRHLSNYVIDLRKHGYSYDGSSTKTFQAIWKNDKFAVGERINSYGWFEATFYRRDQHVEFD